MIYASAPGKLNLFFEVGPLRPDGYHSVISIYQALAIRQRVGVEPHSKWDVITEGDLPQQQLDLVPKDEKNLCVIAAKALAEYAGIANPQPMRFLTHKQVPVAAGLAGGSADAAASLITPTKQTAIATSLVAAFLRLALRFPHPCVMRRFAQFGHLRLEFGNVGHVVLDPLA